MPLMAPGSATGHQTPSTTAGYNLMPTPVACSSNPSGLPGLGATNEHLVASWDQQLTTPAATWTQTPATMAFCEAHDGDVVGPSQPHLVSVDRRPTSDSDVPHLVSVDRRPNSQPGRCCQPHPCPPPSWRPPGPGLHQQRLCIVVYPATHCPGHHHGHI